MKRIVVFSLMASLLLFTACKKEFTITVKSNNESWGKVTGGGNYAKGTEVTLKATPTMSTYRFVKWEDGNTENPRKIVVKQSATYTAIFEETTGGGGGIVPQDPLDIHTGIACIDALATDMILVNGGTFPMGALTTDTNAYPNERPQHNVTLSDFYICKYEVTQELWEAVMGGNPTYNSDGWTEYKGKGAKYPAYRISWNNCDTFIHRLNDKTGLKFRMPTEAEWEFAAKGGNVTNRYTYAGSNILGDVAWCKDNSNDKTHEVMQKSPNELGLYDMSGNVEEWCSDWYDVTYYRDSRDAVNPQGPASGTYRVSRGGDYDNGVNSCRVLRRNYTHPRMFYTNYGMRLALSAE